MREDDSAETPHGRRGEREGHPEKTAQAPHANPRA